MEAFCPHSRSPILLHPFLLPSPITAKISSSQLQRISNPVISTSSGKRCTRYMRKRENSSRSRNEMSFYDAVHVMNPMLLQRRLLRRAQKSIAKTWRMGIRRSCRNYPLFCLSIGLPDPEQCQQDTSVSQHRPACIAKPPARSIPSFVST